MGPRMVIWDFFKVVLVARGKTRPKPMSPDYYSSALSTMFWKECSRSVRA